MIELASLAQTIGYVALASGGVLLTLAFVWLALWLSNRTWATALRHCGGWKLFNEFRRWRADQQRKAPG